MTVKMCSQGSIPIFNRLYGRNFVP